MASAPLDGANATHDFCLKEEMRDLDEIEEEEMGDYGVRDLGMAEAFVKMEAVYEEEDDDVILEKDLVDTKAEIANAHARAEGLADYSEKVS